MFEKTIIVGHVGRDPEMRFLPNGQAVTSFSVATNRQYKDAAGQVVKETTWFNVSVFGKQADSCNKFLQKGSKVLVEGRLQSDKNGGPRIWSGQDGQPHASFEIVASDVRFLSSKSEGDNDTANAAAETDEIPF